MFRPVLILCLLVGSLASVAVAGELRPPAVPLVAHDPYFSVWSAADKLTDVETSHWTGLSQPLRSVIRVDGESFRLMGLEPAAVPPMPQHRVQVLPTRTVCRFADQRVAVTLTFLTPALPSDLDLLARPVTYITWTVESRDAASHRVQVYFECGGEIAVNTPDQQVTWDRSQAKDLTILRIGSQEQPVLEKKGDNLRIDWGYGYLAVPAQQNAQTVVQDAADAHAHFIETGELLPSDDPRRPRAVQDGHPALIVRYELSDVSDEPRSCWLMIGYDDVAAIRYFRSSLSSYWARSGLSFADLLQQAAGDYQVLTQRCIEFDRRMVDDLVRVGGEQYSQLCALLYRQTLAGNKIVADANGMPLMFPKENFSNGCIGTVDVIYPQAPFYLLLSPTLTRAMLVPLLDYAQSWRWKFPFAPHDLGTYPFATGQVYGGGEQTDQNQMPVEETGNMLIMMAALSRAEGNGRLAEAYWPLLTQWADYLVAEGLDPANQLCTADMFGHMAHNADLSLKAIIGIGGYAQMCAMLGKSAESDRYLKVAREYAANWYELAQDEGHTRLAFDQPGSWGMKHNLIWDRILGLNLFPSSVGDAEISWYLQVQNRYGLPCDNRTDQSLIDWAVWCLALARDPDDWQALFEPLFNYVHETPQRVAVADWFNTKDASRVGFQARPVVGGVFIRLLADSAAWRSWSATADHCTGTWSPLPVGRPRRVVVATSQVEGAVWRYSLTEPSTDWYRSDFDDSRWPCGLGGFGTEGTPNAVVRTTWNTTDIWLRREVELPSETLASPVLIVHYDESPEIYINGVLAVKRSGYTANYTEVEISREARAALRPGKNVLAVRAHQTWGGQFIDVGLLADESP